MSRNLMLSLVGALTACVLLASCSSDTAGPNRAPVANAGPDLVKDLGAIAELDGSASFDPDGEGLDFSWTILSGPASAQAEIDQPASEHASLTPDLAGVWMIGLVVTDARGLPSEPDVMQLRARSTKCMLDVDCNDGIACTANHCNTSTGVCEYTPDDGLCPDDANFCNGTEYCDSSLGCAHTGDPCAAGSQLCDAAGARCVDCLTDGDCDDGQDCTDDNCADGNCTNTPDNSKCVDDGVFCNGPEICDPQAGCQSGGNPCLNQGLICDEAGRECRACTQDGDCDDSVACTADSCDTGTCIFTPDDNACPDDGDFCNGTEICDRQAGCVGSGDPCTGLDQLCDTGNARCVDCLVSGDCDDGVGCTDDVCDNGPGTCSSSANDGNCADDGQYCNGSEHCDAQTDCVSSGDPCAAVDGDCDEDHDLCAACGDGVVSDGLGEECDPGGPQSDHCCDATACSWITDGDPDPQGVCTGAPECQVDVCDGSGGCSLVNVADHTLCTSNNTFCDGAEECQSGMCVSPGNPCSTAGDCDEINDICAGCGDGVISLGEQCDPGSPKNDHCCDQGNCQWTASGDADPQGVCTGAPECRLDVCDGSGGCGIVNQGDGTPCSDDGTYCNGSEECASGACGHSGNPCPGPDGDSNCNESCNEGGHNCGAYDGEGQACNDGLYCTVTDSCSGGSCQGTGSPCPGPDGDDDCHESCSEGAHNCSAYDGNGQACNDGLYCTLTDSCSGGSCGGTGNPCPGPDGDDNCNESCNEGAKNCSAYDGNGQACNDGLYCTLTDSCSGGSCGGTGNPCPGPDGDDNCNESCNEGAKNCSAYDGNGQACNDGLYCTVTDSCSGGNCLGSGDPCPGPDGDGDCAESCDDDANSCLGNDPKDEACDDGNFCTLGDACDGLGVCNPGSDQKDSDGDNHVDIACGGDDCDDSDAEVNPDMSEGPVCDVAATCFDGKDNECDTFTDGADSDCQAVNFICLDGPTWQVPLGSPGDTLTVRLDGPGYDPSRIVCFTDNARLISPEQMFSNDFEDDLAGFSISNSSRVFRWDNAQNPNTLGDRGVVICRDGNWLMTDAIDTSGRTRIRLRYASRSWSLDDNELFITEYSPDDGGNWYVLDIQGDNYQDSTYQWFTHILPPRCGNISNLRIRFRVRGGDNSDCALVDDFSVYDLPDPTVSWTLLSNHFEAAEGNSTADDCDGETIVHFWDQGNTDGEICLLTAAQNPASTSSGDLQGVRIVDNDPSYLDDPDIDTRLVPPGSDLVAGFWMRELGIGNNSYANAWYFDGNQWYRMNGVGSDTTVDYDWFRFIWEQSAIGRNDAQVSFEIPTQSPMNNGQGIYLDDYDLSWQRASHDIIGPFSDQGDGTYTANIQSDLAGNANVMCIYYGAPPLVTDGVGDNSGSFPIDFGP